MPEFNLDVFDKPTIDLSSFDQPEKPTGATRSYDEGLLEKIGNLELPAWLIQTPFDDSKVFPKLPETNGPEQE